MAPRQIVLTVPDNWHCHLRNGPMLVWMVKMLIASGFRGRVLCMPNTKPNPILDGYAAHAYLKEINDALEQYQVAERFTPVLTIQLTENTSRITIKEADELNIRAAKTYPRYVTTNSELGVVKYETIFSALQEMQSRGMIWCSHCEHPDDSVEGLRKEEAFIGILEKVRKNFPTLKIVVEHITTKAMVKWVKQQDTRRVRATITPHHLVITLDDVLGYSKRSGGKMNVHNGCKPQPKHLEDLLALQDAAVSGDSHFFYGGDDAPHPQRDKWNGACGVFHTTVAPSLLIDLFERRHASSKLNLFLSEYGAEFYQYPKLTDTVTFREEPWVVPETYRVRGTNDSVVPFLAGEEALWKFVG